MLREVDLDVVSIAMPGGLHHEIALAAAAAGKHVLCEKPFATSLTEARDMLAAVAQGRSRPCGQSRIPHDSGTPGVQADGRRRLAGDTIFDVRALLDIGMLLNPARPWSWWSDREQYGGMLQAMTSHLIDFLLWTFGDIAPPLRSPGHVHSLASDTGRECRRRSPRMTRTRRS